MMYPSVPNRRILPYGIPLLLESTLAKDSKKVKGTPLKKEMRIVKTSKEAKLLQKEKPNVSPASMMTAPRYNQRVRVGVFAKGDRTKLPRKREKGIRARRIDCSNPLKPFSMK